MTKILFEGINIRDIEVTPNGVIKKKKKEKIPEIFDFNDIDYYLLENEIKLVRQLHNNRLRFYEENIIGQPLTRTKVQACLVLRDIERDAVKGLHQMMEDILDKTK